jgi:hypothetical protein
LTYAAAWNNYKHIGYMSVYNEGRDITGTKAAKITFWEKALYASLLLKEPVDAIKAFFNEYSVDQHMIDTYIDNIVWSMNTSSTDP